MKTPGTMAASLVAGAVALTRARAAVAVESRADVETDHIDPADDGGPRTAGVLVRASPVMWGTLGAEVDMALGAHAALSVEGDWLPFGPIRAYAASVGMPLFLQRFAFHGLYLHPRLEWAWASPDAGSGQGSLQVGSAAVLVGYEWTCLPGATLRLAGGIAYSKAMGGDAAPSSLAGLHPELDAAIGWIF
jgi:hypothetical protein